MISVFSSIDINSWLGKLFQSKKTHAFSQSRFILDVIGDRMLLIMFTGRMPKKEGAFAGGPFFLCNF
jgi:hypothetical protein